MKKILALFLFLLFSGMIFAQTSQLTVFSEDGDGFYLILNGEKYNDATRTNVKATEILPGSYIVKVIFEDKSIGELDKRLVTEPGRSYTFVIKKNRKGDYKLRYMGETTFTPAVREPQSIQRESHSVSTQTSTQNEETLRHQSNIGVSINESSEGVSINMNVNIDEGQHLGAASATSTGMDLDVNTQSHTTEAGTETHYIMPGYSGPIGCPWPMPEDQFIQVQQSIDSKSFEDSKLIMAKQVIASNCLLSSQVKRIMELFNFEDTRLELAKYAYGYTYDLGNYFQLNDAFNFESSIEELNEYIMNN